ncbi:twin-arginine translocase TatA/TatE family subunit [Homoserinibacter sp. GY 40078]|uniref:Sec-independent protein translocase subunit TatA/TatB n=1 Tax=Homoserinibacter sp. GY 40078 TaxID=2603275 RepID=UPI0011CBFECF|nr:twin-arginine translocase TatA/TatE family subunit [Homoserinibacter sp. GY 40078]TXK17636.1 twin-arginine translocase TatA/TatE family subunit [Homoserinibacter sp. GY 40078]
MLIHPLLVNQWQSWLIVLLVVLVLFGATRLPALSKSLGQSIKIFRRELAPEKSDDAAEPAESTAREQEKPSSTTTDK